MLLRAFKRDTRGQVALTFALALIPIVGAVGVAVDYSRAGDIRARLQTIADAAALDGAKQYVAKIASLSAEDAAKASLTSNLGKMTVASQTVAADGKSVTVSLTSSVPATFLGIFSIKTIDVAVKATAGANSKNARPVCVHALDQTMKDEIIASGGSSLVAPDCIVWSNSNSTAAITLSGGSKLTAYQNCIHGGFSQGLASTKAAPTDCGIRADPFASMNPTTPTACSFNKFSSGAKVINLTPGVYCGGLVLSGGPTVTLQPGVYVIRDGKFTMSGGGSMTGNGVVFVIEGTATVDLSGGGSYTLTAPKTGDFAGFIFFQRPTASPNAKANLSGGGAIYFEGVIYFPTQNAIVSGGGAVAAVQSPFTAYIAKSFNYSGGSTLAIKYDPANTKVPIPPGILIGGGVALTN